MVEVLLVGRVLHGQALDDGDAEGGELVEVLAAGAGAAAGRPAASVCRSSSRDFA